MEPDIFSGDVTNLYKHITAIPTPPNENHFLYTKQEINVMYKFDNVEVKSYPPPRPHKLGKLPYIFLTVYRDNESSFGVFALTDTGCTSSMISSDFVARFPQFLKDQIVPLDLTLGVASSQASSKITGKIDLLVSIKSSPGDRYPLIFTHTFLIGYKLSKDMFIGYDLLGLEDALVSISPDSIALKYPPHYEFHKDPHDTTGFKYVPFIMMDADESAATNNFRLTLHPQQIAELKCKLLKPHQQGKLVHVRNFTHYSIFESYPMARDNMPEILNVDTYVDENNCVSVTCVNRENNVLTLPPHFPFARIVSYSETDELASNLEVNLVENEMGFYSSFQREDEQDFLSQSDQQILMKMDEQNNWLQGIEDDPVVQEVPNTLENVPEPSEAKCKSDFTPEQFLDMFDFKQSDPTLTEDYKRIVLKYRQAFAHFPMDILECTNYVHDIEIVGKPTLPKYRPPPEKVCEPVNQMIDAYMGVDIMSTRGPRKHYSNIVPVIKPSGALRTCVDMILINRCIRSDDKIVLMGSPQQIFQRLHDAPYFLILDHHSAYYHIKASEHCRQYYGIYSYRPFMENLGYDRVIQGEKTAVYTYNRMSNQNYGRMQGRAVNWIDDWCIYANTKEDMIRNFEQFCDITVKAGLSISPSKSCFSDRELHFLGVKFLRKERCRVIPEATIQGILDLKPPMTWKQLRSFLSTLRYYNVHMPGVAIAATPLQLLLRKATSKTFTWTSQLQKAWLETKQAVAESVALYDPYPGGHYRLYTDASQYTYAMMLYSVSQNTADQPRLVATASGTFSEQALAFSIYHKELLAVVYAVRKWIPYFYGARIELYTDNKALLYLAESKSDFAVQYRLAMQLSSLNISFWHCKGTSNPADFSSRQWQAFLDQTSIKTMTKTKKRTQDDILNAIANIKPKHYYSPEEVKILLTHNFKTPFDVQRLRACEERYESILSKLTYSKPLMKAGCCDDCRIEISQIQFAAAQENFALPKYEVNALSEECNRCHVSFKPTPHVSSSSFNLLGRKSKYEVNQENGQRVLDYFEGTHYRNIMFVSEVTGNSLVSNNCLDSIDSLREIRAFNYFTDPKNAMPTSICSSSQFWDTYEIFNNFPYIAVNRNQLFHQLQSRCRHSRRCRAEARHGAANLKSQPYLIGKFLYDTLTPRKFQANAIDEMTPYHELENPFQYITKQDRLRATVFKFGFLTLTAFQKAQDDDFRISKIKTQLRSSQSKQRDRLAKTYTIIRDILFRKSKTEFDELEGELTWKLCIPEVLIPFILQKEHVPPTEKLHVEGGVMFKNMQRKYFFPNMRKLAYDFVKSCLVCAYVVVDKKAPHFFGKTKTIHRPMGHIMLDYAVELPPSAKGYKHIAVAVCTFTRFVVLMPCKTRSAPELLENFIRSFLPIFGFPEKITADQELSFHSGEFYEYMTKHGVLVQKLMAYRPNSAGKVESQVKRIKHALATFCIAYGDREWWVEMLPLIAKALNNNFVTSIGTSPFHALFCFQPHDQTMDILRMDTAKPMPDDPHEYMIQRIDRDVIDRYITLQSDKAFQRNTKHLNKNTIDRDFYLGQKVMRRVHSHALGPKINRSLCGKYCGPYTVWAMSEYCLFLYEDADADYQEKVRQDIAENRDETVDGVYRQRAYPPEIVEHKSFCKPFDPKECDFILTSSFMDEVEKVATRKHTMITRAGRRNNNSAFYYHKNRHK